ncbi:MAG: hypothetical protein ABIQ44_06620, partial [Chloroflexia bacterium]
TLETGSQEIAMSKTPQANPDQDIIECHSLLMRNLLYLPNVRNSSTPIPHLPNAPAWSESFLCQKYPEVRATLGLSRKWTPEKL